MGGGGSSMSKGETKTQRKAGKRWIVGGIILQTLGSLGRGRETSKNHCGHRVTPSANRIHSKTESSWGDEKISKRVSKKKGKMRWGRGETVWRLGRCYVVEGCKGRRVGVPDK